MNSKSAPAILVSATAIVLAGVLAPGLRAWDMDADAAQVPHLLEALDANGDGELCEQEIEDAAAALLALDRNGDGRLSPMEIAPPAELGEDPGPQPKGLRLIVNALDLNGDRILSADEIDAAPVSLLALDKDGDGRLCRRELLPGRPVIDPVT